MCWDQFEAPPPVLKFWMGNFFKAVSLPYLLLIRLWRSSTKTKPQLTLVRTFFVLYVPSFLNRSEIRDFTINEIQ
jgi:hypothetical protein